MLRGTRCACPDGRGRGDLQVKVGRDGNKAEAKQIQPLMDVCRGSQARGSLAMIAFARRASMGEVIRGLVDH